MPENPGAGDCIRYWRKARGLSQMRLALDVGVSPRHMSFVETGRSRPSRDLLVRLAAVLEVPSREENALLETAGFARRHRASDWSDPGMDHVRQVLRFLLGRHEPNSALVFDANWDIVMSNEAHRRATEFFVGPHAPDAVLSNLLRLTFHPDGLRPHIANWGIVASALLKRLDREIAEAPSASELRQLADEVRSYGTVPRVSPTGSGSTQLLLPVHLRKGEVDVRLFTVLSTIGAAIDVTLQELRLESFFPADAHSERAMRALTGPCPAGA